MTQDIHDQMLVCNLERNSAEPTISVYSGMRHVAPRPPLTGSPLMKTEIEAPSFDVETYCQAP